MFLMHSMWHNDGLSTWKCYNIFYIKVLLNAIKFLIAWGLLGYITDLIFMAIVAGVAHLLGEGL